MQLSKGDKVFDFIIYAVLIILLLVTLYPLYYTVIASFSDPYAVAKGQVSLFPIDVSVNAYKQVFAYSYIWTGYRNTIFYTICGTTFNLFLTVPAAYGLSKKTLPGRTGITFYFLFTMYFSGGLVPTYLMVRDLGLVNSPIVLIIMGGISIYSMVITRTYFTNNIPDELYEAARIDGATELTTFFRIALPLAGPIIAVIALQYAVGHWNNYFTAMVYVTKRSLEPLQSVLRRVLILNENALNEEIMQEMTGDQLLDSAKRAYAAYTMRFSMVFIGSLPLLVVYPFIQKYFVKGMMVGSLKG